MKKALIRVEDVTKEYTIQKKGWFRREEKVLTALNHVELEIYEGEVLGLVGESGCGKSTLGKVILQLEKETDGRVYFEETEVTALRGEKLRDFRKRMQLIFQDPNSALNAKRKIGWLLEEPLRVHGVQNPKERKELVKKMLEVVGLSKSYLERYPSELSGGQAQRIAILTAIMLQPSFIVADEAVSSLDVSIQAQILNFLNELKAQYRLTTLFITHDLSVCYYMSDRIAVMYLGNIVEIGPAEAVYRNPQHPYTKLLLSSLVTIEGKREAVEVNGELASPINITPSCPFYSRCTFRRSECQKKLPDLKWVGEGHKVRCIWA